MSTTVQSIMTAGPSSLHADDSLLAASRLLKEKGFKHIPIVNGGGGLVGVVTDRDLKQASASDATTLEVHELHYLLDRLKLEQVMTRDPVTVAPSDSIQTAAGRMADKHIGCLPVVDAGKLVGIVTNHDLVRLLSNCDV